MEEESQLEAASPVQPLTQRIAGTVSRVEWTRHKQGRDWYCVLIETGEYKTVKRVIGFFDKVFPGEDVKFTGEYEPWAGLGSIFTATHVESFQPITAENIILYLQGITEVYSPTCRAFVQQLGDNPSHLLAGPEDLIWARVSGLPSDDVKSFIKEWKSRINNTHILEIAERHGITVPELERLRASLEPGTDIEALFKINPYEAYKLGAVPFSKCLALAQASDDPRMKYATFAATMYKALLSKYNTNHDLYHSFENVFTNTCRSIGVTKRSRDYADYRSELQVMLDDYLNDVVATAGEFMALRRIVDMELSLGERIHGMVNDPEVVLPDISEDILAEICQKRYPSNVAVSVFGAIKGIGVNMFTIVDCHLGMTLRELSGLASDLFSMALTVTTVVPNESRYLEIKETLTQEASLYTVGEYIESEDLSAGAVIIAYADQYTLPQLSGIFNAIPKRCPVILIGDSSQPIPSGHGNPYHDLMQSKECKETIVDIKTSFEAVGSDKAQLILAMERGAAIDLVDQSNQKSDLLVGAADTSALESIVDFYSTKYCDHIGIDPDQDMAFVLGGEADEYRMRLNRMGEVKFNLRLGRHYSVSPIPTKNIGVYESININNNDGEKFTFKIGGSNKSLKVKDYKYFSPGSMVLAGQRLNSSEELILLILNPPNENLDRSLIINALSSCKKIIVTGGMEGFSRMAAEPPAPLKKNLRQAGFSKRRMNKQQSAKIYDDDESDIIDFD